MTMTPTQIPVRTDQDARILAEAATAVVDATHELLCLIKSGPRTIKFAAGRRVLQEAAGVTAELAAAWIVLAEGAPLADAFPDGKPRPDVMTPRQVLALASLAAPIDRDGYGAAADVDCPFCSAPAGEPCVSSAGWPCAEPHAKRRGLVALTLVGSELP
jgi:hypothetical protein